MKAIAAMTQDRVIGLRGGIPWKNSEDMRFFKETTTGNVVLMGRGTYESMGRPLPRRINWVVSSVEIPGVRTIHGLDEDLSPPPDMEVFLIGGGKLYQALLPRCTELFITILDQKHEGDTMMPQFEHLFHNVGVIKEIMGGKVWHYVNKDPSVQ